MFFEKIYDFDSQTTPANDEWEFINPRGTIGLMNRGTSRSWSWSNGPTPSSRVGPLKPYSGRGYIYTEASSSRRGDKFIMITKNTYNGTDGNLSMKLRYSADTDNRDVQLVIEIYTNGKWHKEYDKNVKSKSPDWHEIKLDLSKYLSDDIKIRIIVDLLTRGTMSRKDVGIDNIIISGDDTNDDEVTVFLSKRNVRKFHKNKGTFDARHFDHTHVKEIINELKAAKIKYVNYPHGVLVIEEPNKIHLIKEEV